MRKVAIFGGSFDPIHLGHLIIAQDILEQLHLDEGLLHARSTCTDEA